MESKRKALIERIMEMSRQGRFISGKLPSERDFAQELEVSRGSLREALVTMEGMGIVEIRGREGVFMVPRGASFDLSLSAVMLWPDRTMDHLMETRKLVEIPAAGLAAKRMDRSDLDKIRKCLVELERVDRSPEEDGARWDSLLHMSVVEGAKNPLISRVFEGLALLMERYIGNTRRQLFATPGLPEEVLNQHRRLVEALERGDDTQAMRITEEHLEMANRLFRESL
ncbi:MAG: FadR family transcriptional regulator [Synergistales bacterium]|nr:FadR family transcriptional regulator [Synergistales bacterium]